MLTLLELLEANPEKIPPSCKRGIAYLEIRWREKGMPAGATELSVFLDAGLKFCTEIQYRYPKIFLKRLKQLQRREWTPRAETIQ